MALAAVPDPTVTGSKRLSVSPRHLRRFEPAGLGARYPDFADLLAKIAGKPQSSVLVLLQTELHNTDEQSSPSDIAFALAVSVLADYVSFGNYPIIRDGRCYLVNAMEAQNLPEQSRRTATKRLFQRARNRSLAEKKNLSWLERVSADLESQLATTHDVISKLRTQPPRTVLLGAKTNNRVSDTRGLWRAVRATWSMSPEASAPGREVAFVAVDELHPATPLGILQFRNVVPEIVARDRWLGISAGFTQNGEADGYLRLIRESPLERLKATRLLLRTLLDNVNTQGLNSSIGLGGQSALNEIAVTRRRMFDEARRRSSPDAATHLHVVKRAETAGDLLRGIGALDALIAAGGELSVVRDSPDRLRDLNAGLRKIWHYHMGFVAMEMSICGAAPPFGPLRVGKLMASMAGSDQVIAAWGRDRPLGQIAAETYLPEVRDVVPNPGPIVVFTSGVYPGHSAQYNRLRVGQARWTKIGETVGYGSFHVSVNTSRLATEYNAVIDGYKRVTRAFGEGSSAKFRDVGRAIKRLELPDLLKHEIARPLYALPLVSDVQGALLGWNPSQTANGLPLRELSQAWWARWVEPSASQLVERALASPDLVAELTTIIASLRAASEPAEQAANLSQTVWGPAPRS